MERVRRCQQWLDGRLVELANPLGEIAVAYERKRGEWEIEVDLPGNLKGSFVWEGRSYPLKAGRNRMVIRG